jgi:hypothetical protein
MAWNQLQITVTVLRNGKPVESLCNKGKRKCGNTISRHQRGAKLNFYNDVCDHDRDIEFLVMKIPIVMFDPDLPYAMNDDRNNYCLC